MKTAKHITSEPVLYRMAAAMALGAGLSMMFTSDNRWIDWHLSRLGEGGQLSAMIFNIAVGLCALFMGAFTRRLAEDIHAIASVKWNKKHVEAVIIWGLGVIAISMMGVAMFPFDRFPVIHNTFGYTMIVTFVALVLTLPNVLPIFTPLFRKTTYAFVAVTALLFTFYFATGGTGVPLLYIEILALSFFYAWAIMLTRTIRQAVYHVGCDRPESVAEYNTDNFTKR